MKIIDIVTAVLLIIGGLAWGLYGLFEFNFIEFFFKSSEEFHVHRHPSHQQPPNPRLGRPSRVDAAPVAALVACPRRPTPSKHTAPALATAPVHLYTLYSSIQSFTRAIR